MSRWQSATCAAPVRRGTPALGRECSLMGPVSLRLNGEIMRSYYTRAGNPVQWAPRTSGAGLPARAHREEEKAVLRFAALATALVALLALGHLPAPAYAASTPVSIVDFAFNPKTISVPAGTTIEWTHDGSFTHTVTADNGN